MSRFQFEEKSHKFPKALLSLLGFAVIFVVFFWGISNFASDTSERQRESLENALQRTITYCYTVEGAYPESLDYLQTHYGLTYDEDTFYVDYRVQGSNIYPDYTIIERAD